MRKGSGTSTLRPFTTTSAFGAASGVSSSITMVRSESAEWVDMLGNSFLFRVRTLQRARVVRDTRRRGMRGCAARRCKVSTTHLLPLESATVARHRDGAAVKHSRVVRADGSPCSPGRATKIQDLFPVLRIGFIPQKLPG